MSQNQEEKETLPNSMLALKNGINLLSLDDFSSFKTPHVKSHYCRLKTKQFCFFSVIFENGFAVFAIPNSTTSKMQPKCIIRKNLRGTISKVEVWTPFFRESEEVEQENPNEEELDGDENEDIMKKLPDPFYCLLIPGDEQNSAFPKNQVMFLNIRDKQEISKDLTLFCKDAVLDVFLINFGGRLFSTKPTEADNENGEMCVVVHEKIVDIYVLKSSKNSSKTPDNVEKKEKTEENPDNFETKSSFLSGDPKYESFSSFAKTGTKKEKTPELLDDVPKGPKAFDKKLSFFPKPVLSFPLDNKIFEEKPEKENEDKNEKELKKSKEMKEINQTGAEVVVYVSHNIKHDNILLAHTTNTLGFVKFSSFRGSSLLYLSAEGDDSILFNPQYCPIESAKRISKSIEFKCHDSPIKIIRLSNDGKLLATASDNGKFVRLFCTKNGKQVEEFRRGSSSCQIYSFDFSDDSQSIILNSSDRKTIHFFSLKEEDLKLEKYLFFGNCSLIRVQPEEIIFNPSKSEEKIERTLNLMFFKGSNCKLHAISNSELRYFRLSVDTTAKKINQVL